MTPSILVLSLSSIERDPRVLRQIDALRELGDVYSAGYGAKPSGVVTHLQIPESMRKWRDNYRLYYGLVLTRRLRRLYDNAPWARFLRENIAPGSYDVIVANDASAVPIALSLHPRHGIHADMHEYATRQSEGDPRWERYQRPINEWIVREHLVHAQSVTTVSRGLADAYDQEFGISAQVVPNAARHYSGIEPTPTPHDAPIRLVHTGAAGRGRRLEIMMDGVATANHARPGAFALDLYLMPGDAEYIAELRQHAVRLRDQGIQVLDPVPFDQIVPTLTAYDLGIFVCPPTTFNLKYTVPNKLFEFVQARLGIIIGPSPDMRTYVDEYQLGVVTKDFTADALAGSLLELGVTEVDEMKAASHRSAPALSSEPLSQPWVEAVRALVGSGQMTGPQ